MRFAIAVVACLLPTCLPCAAEAHGGWGFSYHYAPPPPPPCYHYCPPAYYPPAYYPPPVVDYHHGGHGHYGHGHHGHHGHHRPRASFFFGF